MGRLLGIGQNSLQVYPPLVVVIHIQELVDVDIHLVVLVALRGLVELLQLVVQPHLDGEPLPDERHLVRAVLGREELLPPLLDLHLLGEVDVQAVLGRRALRPRPAVHGAAHGARAEQRRGRGRAVGARQRPGDAALHVGMQLLQRLRLHRQGRLRLLRLAEYDGLPVAAAGAAAGPKGLQA